MIFLWILYQIFQVPGLIAHVFIAPLQAAAAIIPLPVNNPLQLINNYIAWFFPTDFYQNVLHFVLLFYSIMFVLWILKKVKDLPGIP